MAGEHCPGCQWFSDRTAEDFMPGEFCKHPCYPCKHSSCGDDGWKCSNGHQNATERCVEFLDFRDPGEEEEAGHGA